MHALGSRAALLAVLVGTTLAPAGCASGDAAACPAPTPVDGSTQLAEDIRAERLGVVVAAQEAGGFGTVTIESDLSVGDLRGRINDALRPLGLRQLSVEDEGFEAEIYFSTDDAASSAVARVRENPECSGRTTVQLSVSDDRVTTAPSPTAS